MQGFRLGVLAVGAVILCGCAGKPYPVFAVQVAWAPTADTASIAAAGPLRTPRAERRSAGMDPRHPQWDLNRAQVAELKRLPGADALTVAKIVAGRPYRTKRELVSRGVVDAADYTRWKAYLVVHRAAATGTKPVR